MKNIIKETNTKVHTISDVLVYPNFHFSIFTPSRLEIHSNVEINQGEVLKLDGKYYNIVNVKKVKPSNPDMIKEASDTLIVDGEVLNPRYKIGVTKFYTLEVKEVCND